LHHDPEVFNALATHLYDAFQRACAFFNPGHTGSPESAFAQWVVLDGYWRWALGRVSVACPTPALVASDTAGDAKLLQDVVDMYFAVNVRGMCGESLGSVCRQLVDRVGVVSAAVAKEIVSGTWSAIGSARRKSFSEHTLSTGSTMSLEAALSLYFAVREGSRLPADRLVQRVFCALCGGLAPDGDGDEESPAEAAPEPAVGGDGDVQELSVSDRQKLSLRVYGALALRWEGQVGAARSVEGRLWDSVNANVDAKGVGRVTGGPSAAGPCFLPMPRPQGVPIRLRASDVRTVLRRARHVDGPSEGSSGGSGSGTASLLQLFNADHPAIAGHVQRYGDLGRSVLFTGGGLRFLVPKVSVGYVCAPVRDAAEWSGACRDALKPAPKYDRPLYGKDPLEARSAEEIRAKQRAFILGQPGAYLLEHHLTPTLVREYLRRTSARVSLADPGVCCPLAFWNGSYLSLGCMYRFLACSYHREPKPDEVQAAEAALSGFSPRRGVAGLAGYVTQLAMVGSRECRCARVLGVGRVCTHGCRVGVHAWVCRAYVGRVCTYGCRARVHARM
jgi:hypothetical protein